MTRATPLTSDPTADSVVALLRHFGYRWRPGVPGRYEVWSVPDTDGEILVPLDPESGDFAALLTRAVRTVIAEQGSAARSTYDLLNLRASAALDSTQWRKETTSASGLIPWSEGEALFHAAQLTLSASAKTTRMRRMVHGTSSAYVARRFLEKTLMGQTAIGSFIITAHTPSNQKFFVSQKSENQAQADYRHSERVTGRDILSTLHHSLEAVRSGLDEYKQTPRLEAFLPLVEDGVSYELVKALSTISDGGDAAVVIEFNGGTNQQRRMEVSFGADESNTLSRVADRFALAEPPKSVRVTGEVSGLDNSTASPVHLVKLDIVSGADVRHARVRLNPQQYAMAIQAHAESLWLSVAGQLEKDGREYWLYGAQEVSFVTPPPGAITTPIELTLDDDLYGPL